MTSSRKKALKRTSYLAAAILALAIAVGLLWWFDPGKSEEAGAHIYGDPRTSIEDIDLYVFYAVPQDQTPYDFETVRLRTEKILADAAAFHRVQLLGKSRLHYKLYPAPIILKEDALYYNGDSTARGNPNALVRVTYELDDRVFHPAGDLYNAEFVSRSAPESYFVVAIIYEGVGASGGEGGLLVSRDFVTRDEYALMSSALFYHEFGHSIGLPEGYDTNTNAPFTNDIMGSGRREPLRTNYIDDKYLKGLGVLK